jgi:hypothetical protein
MKQATFAKGPFRKWLSDREITAARHGTGSSISPGAS